MRLHSLLFLYLFLALISPVSAQTPAPQPAIYSTLESGQLTRFEYSARAADVQISNLLTAIFISLWGMFIIIVFVVWRVDKR
jgi:hypothetical protein